MSEEINFCIINDTNRNLDQFLCCRIAMLSDNINEFSRYSSRHEFTFDIQGIDVCTVFNIGFTDNKKNSYIMIFDNCSESEYRNKCIDFINTIKLRDPDYKYILMIYTNRSHEEFCDNYVFASPANIRSVCLNVHCDEHIKMLLGCIYEIIDDSI